MDKNAKKNLIYSAFLIVAMLSVYVYRNYINVAPSGPAQAQSEVIKMKLEGLTMGTNYSIAYFDSANRNLQKEIDSVLVDYNLSLSTYIPNSEIFRFNTEDSVSFSYPYFYPVLKRAEEIYKATNGAFDPTVMPLVNAWGFGPAKRSEVPQSEVDSLLELVGFENIAYDMNGVRKSKKGVSLDFSAIAKGNGIDVVAQFLETRDIHNYMVLIGGEANCKGGNDKGQGWIIGIDDPKVAETGNTKGVDGFALKNRSIATSGNYRRFYVKEGKKYAHTIDPKTGYPVSHSLLSASVFAKDCTTADAYATAFMVLGLEKAIEMLEADSSLEGFLIYDENGTTKTFATAGAQKMQIQLNSQ